MPVEPPPELVAGRYRLGPVIGRGGMGEVRRGRDLRLDREVAVKLLRSDLAEQPEVRRRFEEEARSAAQLVHPNVVATFDSGEHAGAPYIVMECLPGRTLADELAEGPLATARVRQVAAAVLGALSAAHRVGIVHRDVKPANILVADDGSAKVADFGIAKSTQGLDLTIAGQVIGTPAYLAPERLDGQPATPQSDLYSLGVVLYEALAGRQPFSGETPLALAHAVHTTTPVPLGQLRPDLAPDLVATVERAMDRVPARRFPDAGAMADSLTAGVTASPAGCGGAARDNAVPGDATRLVSLGSTQRLPGPPVTEGRAADSPAPDPAPDLPRRDRSWLATVVGVAVVGVVAGAAVLATRDQAPEATSPPTTVAATDPSAPDPSASPPGGPGGELPPPLDDALRRLEEAVRG